MILFKKSWVGLGCVYSFFLLANDDLWRKCKVYHYGILDIFINGVIVDCMNLKFKDL